MQKFHEVVILTAAAMALYVFGFWLQSVIFQFTEHLPGVNWFYLPAGFRVVLVFVMGIHGAIGVALASLLIDLYYYTEFSTAKVILTAFASGFSPWIVLLFLHRFSDRWHADQDALRWVDLMNFALLYAMVNAASHQLVWQISEAANHVWWIDLWPMFVGDLTGASAMLLLARALLRQRSQARQS